MVESEGAASPAGIENGAAILREFLDTFMIQEHAVQLALLTAVVKIFLRNPAGMERTLNAVLELVTQQSNTADLRDRAYFYWRLLAEGVGVEAMKHIVHGRKAPVDADTTVGHGMSKGDIVNSVNTTAAVLGRPARTFVTEYGLAPEEGDEDEELDDGEDSPGAAPSGSAEAPAAVSFGSEASPVTAPAPAPAPKTFVDPLDDICGPTPVAAPASAAPQQMFPATAAPAQQRAAVAVPFDPFASPPRPTAAPAGGWRPAPSRQAGVTAGSGHRSACGSR